MVKQSRKKAVVGTATAKYDESLKTMSYTARENWLAKFRSDTSSGSRVTEENVMTIDTFFACAKVLAESMATLPFDLIKTTGNASKQRIVKASDNPIYDLMRWQPNEETTSYEFRYWLMMDCIIWGRGAAQIQRDGKGKPIALWQLAARYLCPKRTPDGRLVYTYKYQPTQNGELKEVLLEANEVFQIQMMPYGGLLGYSLTMMQAEAIGASKAAEQYSSEFFANGGAVTGVLEVPETLSEEAYKRLKKDWKESHTKTGKRHGIPILEGDAKFKALSLDHEQTQLLETRRFSRSVIAGLLRVPAHLVNDLEKATFSNIEHQDLAYVKHGLRPWMTNWEQRANMSLLTPAERKTLQFKHNDRDLLRGDFPSRMAAYAQGVNAGVMSPNDCRRAEDMDPYDGGDTYYVQGALRPTDQPYQSSSGAAPSTPAKKEE